MSEQLRLGLGGLGKLLCQDARNPLMVVVARTSHEGLIGCFLDEDVLEDISRVRRQTSRVEQLGLDQLRKGLPQGRLVQRGNRAEQFIGEVTTDGGSQLGHRLRCCQPVQPRHKRVVQRCGNRQRGERPL